MVDFNGDGVETAAELAGLVAIIVLGLCACGCCYACMTEDNLCDCEDSTDIEEKERKRLELDQLNRSVVAQTYLSSVTPRPRPAEGGYDAFVVSSGPAVQNYWQNENTAGVDTFLTKGNILAQTRQYYFLQYSFFIPRGLPC